MIKNIILKFGRTSASQAETISTTPITVFVGPNNSGKSKVLSEIHRFCTHGNQNQNDVIIDKIEFDTYDSETAEEIIKRLLSNPIEMRHCNLITSLLGKEEPGIS